MNLKRKYRKRTLVVEAEQLQEARFIQTVNGTYHCLPGDYLVTGIHGEQYPVDQDVFAATYDPVEEEDEETQP